MGSGVAEVAGCGFNFALALVIAAAGIEPCRLLIALNAMIPATATMCRTSTIKSARDNFMFGSDMSSKSEVGAVARRAAARNRFFGGAIRGSCGSFIFIWAEHGRVNETDRPDQRSF